MSLILVIVCFIITILIAAIISKSLFDSYKLKIIDEINWIYIIWIFLIILSIILSFILNIKKGIFNIIVLILIIISLICWRYFISKKLWILAQVFIIVNIVLIAVNIFLQRNNNPGYIFVLYLLAIWMIVIAFLTFKLDTDDKSEKTIREKIIKK